MSYRYKQKRCGELNCWCFLGHFLICLLLPTHLSPPTSCMRAQLCDPMDCSPPGSSVHELFQAGILEWVAISFSRASALIRVRFVLWLTGAEIKSRPWSERSFQLCLMVVCGQAVFCIDMHINQVLRTVYSIIAEQC